MCKLHWDQHHEGVLLHTDAEDDCRMLLTVSVSHPSSVGQVYLSLLDTHC